MHFDNQVYRPPQEAWTPLLQVTHGCSYDRCTYCSMYDQNPFRVSDWEEVVADIGELAAKNRPYQRLYLVNGDPFCLSTERLLRIIEEVQRQIPTVETFSMYASIRNISAKSDEELKELRSRGINQLYIGIESFFDEALDFVNKGYTGKEALIQLKRLEEAGIQHSSGIMLGLLGAGRGEETGRINGEFFKELKPKEVWLMSTTVMPGTQLAAQRDSGEYVETSEYERVEEIRAFLEAAQMEHRTYFNSIHPTNAFQLEGYLPEDSERLLAECEFALNSFEPDSFQRTFDRKNVTRL